MKLIKLYRRIVMYQEDYEIISQKKIPKNCKGVFIAFIKHNSFKKNKLFSNSFKSFLKISLYIPGSFRRQ